MDQLQTRVVIRPGALDAAGPLIRGAVEAHRYAIVTDSTVGPLYADRVGRALGVPRGDVFTFAAGEHSKTRETWAAVTDRMLDAGFGRDAAVIALGGGVVGDLAGFVAATFMRGLPLIQMPTTVLAMIDASIGGKTGVDTPAGKNLVGAFHLPAAVILDPAVLATLPLVQYRAGLAEALKHGAIADAAHFETVATVAAALCRVRPDDARAHALIARSIEIKSAVVNDDLRESGRRKILNFGHTIGHAVEHLSGYELLHGEAVSIGMCAEAAIAERLGVAVPGTAARIRSACAAAGLPTARPVGVSPDAIVRATRADKKGRAGRAEYALPSGIGSMAFGDAGWAAPVDDALVLDVLR